MSNKLSAEERKRRHVQLHGYLDELVADWIRHTEASPSKTTILELMNWSYEQTQNPTEGKND